LEVDAIELAIKKASPEDLKRLGQELMRFQATIPSGDMQRLAELDFQFHLCLLGIANNPSFCKISRVVMQLFAAPMEEALRDIGPEQVYLNHYALYQAIIARDLLRAKDHVVRAFESSRQFL
jgi:DNA-binding GntR family transcriptional regulator